MITVVDADGAGERGGLMADFIEIAPGDGNGVALFQTAESDLVSPYSGAPDIERLSDSAAGRLEAIADAAEAVYRSLRERLQPDEVELEISVGLSGEVGWFVAKSAASGSIKLTLTWKGESSAP